MINSNRRRFLIGAGFAAAASIMALSRRASMESDRPNIELRPDLRPIIDQERSNILATMARENIPGAAVCLISDGRPAWIEGFGFTDQRCHRAVDHHTLFSIQSASKNFTATAILLAVQQGLLDLDEPISTYLPDFTVQSRFEAAPEKKITLRLLLSHRAGFTHEAPVGNNFDPSFPSFEAHVRSISQTWLRFPVGERCRYSNLGFDLAGYILQTVRKLPFADCLKTMLLDPLGMTDTTAATEEYVRQVDRAIGHEEGYATVPLKIPLIPSGGVYTSARDIAAYLMFQLYKGRFQSKAILRKTLWSEMHDSSLGEDTYALGVQRIDLSFSDAPIHLFAHNGGGFGFGCRLSYIPQAGIAWAALFNRATSGGYQFGTEILEHLLSRRLDVRTTSIAALPMSTVKPPTDQLARLVGNYISRARSIDMKIENSRLGMQIGPAFVPLEFTSPVDVFIKGPGGELATCHYFPARDNEVAHLECSIGDYSLDYNDGPSDVAGPDEAYWDGFLGNYQIYQWGRPQQRMTVHRKNGYLYLNETRLVVELEPGLFFTADGEAVDFRHAKVTWRNIRLERVIE